MARTIAFALAAILAIGGHSANCISENSYSNPESAAEVFENPSTEGLSVSVPDMDSAESEDGVPSYILTRADIQEILSAVSEMVEEYKTVNGVFPWYSWYATRFPPFPSDASYPEIDKVTFETTEGYDILAKFDGGKYDLLFTVMNIQGNWSVQDIQIIEKATGKETTVPPPRYTDQERLGFSDFLMQQLDKSWYAYFDVWTTGVEPVIGYIDGYENNINASIAQYNGIIIETKRVICPYSRIQLEACLNEIENLPVIQSSRANKERKISGIFLNSNKIEILLLKPMPELDKELRQYPPDMIEICHEFGPNPAT